MMRYRNPPRAAVVALPPEPVVSMPAAPVPIAPQPIALPRKPPVFRPPSPALVRRVVAMVAAGFGVPAEQLAGPSRMSPIALPRHVAMYLLNERLGAPMTSVGAAFRRDHTSVFHARRKIALMMATDVEFAQRVEVLAAQAEAARKEGA